MGEGAQTRPRRLKGGWLEARGAQSYTLARHWPPRFDVAASARFPRLSPGRLARQVRQDMWRLLRGLRGFSPVVQITVWEREMVLTAGGRVNGPVPDRTFGQIAALLEDPSLRARWMTWARERRS